MKKKELTSVNQVLTDNKDKDNEEQVSNNCGTSNGSNVLKNSFLIQTEPLIDSSNNTHQQSNNQSKPVSFKQNSVPGKLNTSESATPMNGTLAFSRLH